MIFVVSYFRRSSLQDRRIAVQSQLSMLATANKSNNDFELVVATSEAPSKQTGTKKGNAIDHLPIHSVKGFI
jgi:hypothetical protein